MPVDASPPLLCRMFIVVACAALLTGCGESREEIAAVSSEKEANLILVELANAGIDDAVKQSETRNRKLVHIISVPPDHANEARKVLIELDLPREHRGGLEQFAESAGLIPGKFDEQARMMDAIAGELEKTLETYDRVVRARVHVPILNTDTSLIADKDKVPKQSAAVMIKYRPDPNQAKPEPPMTEQEVKQLVSRAVEGLNEEDVFVTFTTTPIGTRATTAPSPSATAGEGAPTEPMGPADRKLLYELYGAVAGLGLLCIFLIYRLIRRRRPAPAQPA